MRRLFLVLTALVATAASRPQPVIDMHLHALPADSYGPGAKICAPYEEWAPRDPGKPIEPYLDWFTINPPCRRAFTAPATDAELRDRSIAALRKYGVVKAVTSGPAAFVDDWHAKDPERILHGIELGGDGVLPPIEELRRLHAAGKLTVLGEITTQYAGIAPDDPRLEPYFALAEELDIPVALHLGPGPPGVAYFGAPGMRAAAGDPMRLEPVLVRHPRLRIYAMHAGWPMGDAMIALMYTHPQLYVDTGILDYAYRKEDFYPYLKRLVDAGFGRRIMYGSDQMAWPDAIGASIEAIEQAPFLTKAQKRDILYNNAARFLRLER